MYEKMKTITNDEGEYVYHKSLPAYALEESAKGLQPIPLATYAFYEQGDIYINGTIDDELAKDFIMLLRLAAKLGKVLRIHINSPGGSVTAGLAMYDAMKAYPYAVYIYVEGLAASMAAVLAAGGTKGKRFIMPHSKMMVHEPLISGGMGGSATSIQRTAESIMETKKIINSLLAEFTGKSIKEIDENTAYDNYFNAQQAVEFGLCDEVLVGYDMENN